jgi:hypothetical protein
MVPKDNSCAVVIAGFWNRMIFTPQWVAQNIYELPEIEALVAFAPIVPVIYRDESVEMRMSATRLEFIAREHRDENLTRAEQLASRVLERLAVTPVTAVGINFAFSENQPNDRLLELFNFSDNAELADRGWGIDAKRIVRTLSQAEQVLNLTYSLTGTIIGIDLNYHYAVQSAEGARHVIQGQVLNRNQDALTLLRETLALNLEVPQNAD